MVQKFGNAASPRVQLSGIMTCLIVVPANALVPIEVTLAGMVILVKRQSRKAESPMLVTESGIVIREMPQLRKASAPMLVTELGIVISDNNSHPLNAASGIAVMEAGITKRIMFSHPSKAPLPMFVRLDGNSTFLKTVQYANACSPMAVTPAGTVIAVNLLHL